MFGKVLKVAGGFTLGVVVATIFDDDNEKTDAERQLDNLDDGLGNVISEDTFYSREEAETAQFLGDLYDTHY